jgi:hypothetical protein
MTMLRHEPRGQSLVEFALVLPVLMAFLMGFFDLGRVVLANDLMSNAANEAARFAIVHGGSTSTACPVGPPDTFTVIPASSESCPHPSPSKEAIYEVARKFAEAAGSSVTVEVCYGDGCSGDTDASADTTNKRGTPVTVTVHSTVSMAALSLIGIGSFDVSGSSTMLVNH